MTEEQRTEERAAIARAKSILAQGSNYGEALHALEPILDAVVGHVHPSVRAAGHVYSMAVIICASADKRATPEIRLDLAMTLVKTVMAHVESSLIKVQAEGKLS